MKKKGSTLITVVAIFAILFTVGTAIISLTLSSYRLRNVQTKNLESLYSSESGLDEAKKIIEVAVQTAVKKSNYEAVNEATKINEQIDLVKRQGASSYSQAINTIVNERKNTNGFDYKVFLKDESGTNNAANTFYYISNDGTLDLDSIEAKEKNIFKSVFKNIITENLRQCITNDGENYTYQYLGLDNENNISFSNVTLSNGANIELANYNTFGDSGLHISLISTFNSPEGNGRTIKRKIQANYTITVPDLENKNFTNNPLLQKTIAADGSMYVLSNLRINGDIFVKGDASDNPSDLVYGKYDGGINLNFDKSERSASGTELNRNEINVNLNGNVVTSNTLNIKQNSTVNVTGGNLYARNVNLGKIKLGDSEISRNTLNVKTDMLVNNDFTYNAFRTQVHLNNLYAINDITDNTGDLSKAKNSSCIIINNYMNDGQSGITIDKDVFILGSAYINATNGAGEKYQTGESIAIKGNYSAYTSPINDGNKYLFDYFNPLQLVDSVNGSRMTSMERKTRYFLDSTSRNGLPHNGVIELKGNPTDNFLISGAYINGDNAIEPEDADVTKNNTLMNKRKEFANQVYEMGNFNTNSADASTALLQKYNASTVEKDVTNLINISGDIFRQDGDTIVGVYHNKANPILLSDSSAPRTGYSNVININGKKGIIITDSDIVFDNKDLNFTGTIITTRDISTLAGADEVNNISINYDGNLVKELVNKYNLESIFNTSDSGKTQIGSIELNNSNEINTNDLIKTNEWTIIR
ncbi:hypothetical protein [Clostridium paridis]|uniref:DUF2572 family protein n=1 Tax=Clostridium paridis TaxID=2803863 RepID=A0A937K561_9CLOT|nr:hypothetical protein [Clostridium paridis]MBL4933357.1 hypothetical protein [Clostridium paridis]